MGVLMEFAIILGITLAAELLHAVLTLPVPAGIYGMVILLVLLLTGVLKLEKIQRAGKFLLEIMPVMFIPAAVGLMGIVGQMRGALIPVAIIVVLTTVIVMAVTGRTAQGIIRMEERKKHG